MKMYAVIYEPENLVLGDISLFDDGTVTVRNDYEGIYQNFDSFEEAKEHASTRICQNPVFREI